MAVTEGQVHQVQQSHKHCFSMKKFHAKTTRIYTVYSSRTVNNEDQENSVHSKYYTTGITWFAFFVSIMIYTVQL